MDEPDQRRLLIVVGEASGDRHAARVLEALATRGRVQVRGVAGPRLSAAGVTPVVPAETLAVMGFSGVIARLPQLLAAERRLLEDARAFRPHAALLVDTPGFNFRIGPRLHALGIPVFYYIAPQVWAWHAARARAMAAWVTRLAVIFPFEEPLFREAGVNVRWVGHPLCEGLEPEVDERTLRAEIAAPPGAPLLALLPGSRRDELRAHLPVMLAAAARLAGAHPDLVTVVALAPGVDPGPLPANVRAVRGRTHAAQAWATCAVVASGTASLETALFRTPEVVVYRTGAINYAIARRVVRLRHIGLPNIVAGEEVAPELIQHDLTAEALASRLALWLGDPAARAAARERLRVVGERLGGPGASDRAAAWLWELMAGMAA